MSEMDETLAPPRAPLHTHTPKRLRRPRPDGLLDRLKDSLQRLAFGNALYDFSLSGANDEALQLVPPDPWPGESRTGSDLVHGIFRFAGQTRAFTTPDWQPPTVCPQFIAELHGFDWLRDLRALGGDVGRRQARTLVRDWIEQNGNWNPVAWEPAVLSRRITNWLALYDFYCASADDGFRHMVLESLKRQCRHLARALPAVPKGEGRMAALKGLIYSGVCLVKGEGRLAAALKSLGPELTAQVLPDGGHVSRNPSAHLAVLRDLIDIRTILSAGGQEVPEKLQHAIDRMTPALRFFRHGDGGLALFNGGREENPSLIDAVLNHADAKGKPLKSMTHSGYERIVAGRTCILFDGGAGPPPAYDGQAHAAPLAFELSSGRDRLIVNCGAHPVTFDGWRKAMGATAAHSALTLNETNAAELLDTGLGRKPGQVECSRQEDDEAVHLDGSHDGYAPQFATTHHRRLYVAGDGEDIRGEDRLDGPAEQAFTLRFHLHPNVQASLIQHGAAVLLSAPSGLGWRFRASGGSMTLEESLYCGKGDTPRRSLQIVVSGVTGPDSTAIKWALQREKRTHP